MGPFIDGQRAPRAAGDVAIDGDRIVAVADKAGAARRVIEADGLMVTPAGSMCIRITTGRRLGPGARAILVARALRRSCSAIAAGFAPGAARAPQRTDDLMVAVEDIPGTALAEGLNWDWESFPEYLDALERLPRTIDVAAQIPHHPLRVYVMGVRGINREAATPEGQRRDAAAY